MSLTIVRNDILTMHVDAIVNSTRNELLGGGRNDARLHHAAGPGIDAECARIGHCDTGQAVITKGYELPCRYVIHTVGPVWTGGTNHEEEDLRSCYRQSLLLAKEYRCESIAIPLISSGFYGYPKELALHCATDEIRKFLEENEMEIYLVVFDRTAYKISRELYEDVRSYVDDHYVAAVHETYEASYSRPQYDEEYSRPRYDEDSSRPQYDEDYIRPWYGDETFGSAPADAPQPLCAPPPEPKKAREKRKPGKFGLPDIFSKKEKPSKDASVSASVLESELHRFELDESFSECLLRLIDERGMKDSECYKKANIDRKLFSKIRSNPLYAPSKYTAVAFAVALELDYDETQDLLKKAGFTLSHSNQFDVIVEYFILHGIYDIFSINEVLFQFDQKLLGAGK